MGLVETSLPRLLEEVVDQEKQRPANDKEQSPQGHLDPRPHGLVVVEQLRSLLVHLRPVVMESYGIPLAPVKRHPYYLRRPRTLVRNPAPSFEGLKALNLLDPQRHRCGQPRLLAQDLPIPLLITPPCATSLPPSEAAVWGSLTGAFWGDGGGAGCQDRLTGQPSRGQRQRHL